MCLIVKIGLLLCFTINIEYCLCKDWIVISLGLAIGNLYVRIRAGMNALVG